MELNEETLKTLTAQVAKDIAEKLDSFLKYKSKHGFYYGLGDTVYSNENNVIGSGLTKYILDKRPYLLQEFFTYLYNND